MLTHDIPVCIIPPEEASRELVLPNFPDPCIEMNLPTLSKIKQLIDRIKHLSPRLMVRAQSTGELVLHVTNGFVSIETEYKNALAEYCKLKSCRW